MYSHTSINFAHGSLFALYCGDEQPQNRPLIYGSNLDFFKHGGGYFGNNIKFSIGLVFCVVSTSVEVREQTGRVVINCKEQNQSQDGDKGMP